MTESQESTDNAASTGPEQTDAALGGADGDSLPPELEPLSMSLMGRLFGVPLLIIASIVGGAVLVVLLFGGPVQPERRSVDDLLQVLDANSGERSFNMILPKEKELWQAALELSKRLQDSDGGPESVTVAKHLARMVHDELDAIHKMPVGRAGDQQRQELRRGRLLFMIHALGKTRTSEALEPLIDIVRRGQEPYLSIAMQQLGDLHEIHHSRSAIAAICAVLEAGGEARTALTATTVLSVLADENDVAVIEALVQTHLSSDGEVSWSAALALARLGSVKGKSTLLDLLDRSFWESSDRYEVSVASEQVRRYPLPPARVDELLIASIRAASNLDDPDLWGMIERIQSDRSLAVQGAATKAMAKRIRG